MSDLSAGGLRSRTTFIAALRSEDARTGRLGAYLAYRLECAKQQYARANTGRTSETVLRSEPRSIRQVERHCGKTSATARAKLLRSEGILLGRRDSLRTSSPLDRCTRINILGWSSCPSHSDIREKSKPMNKQVILYSQPG
jgi:hypothetical protein